MNEIAEKGYAAHYKYKQKNDKSDDSLDVWINKLQEALDKIKKQEHSLTILHNKLDKLLMKESNSDNYVEIVNKND